MFPQNAQHLGKVDFAVAERWESPRLILTVVVLQFDRRHEIDDLPQFGDRGRSFVVEGDIPRVKVHADIGVVDLPHRFELHIPVRPHVGMRFEGNDDTVPFGNLTRLAQPLVDNLLADAGVLDGQEHEPHSQLLAGGQLDGQLRNTFGLSEIGLPSKHRRAEPVIRQSLPQGFNLIGRWHVGKDILETYLRQMVQRRVLKLPVICQPADESIRGRGLCVGVGGPAPVCMTRCAHGHCRDKPEAAPRGRADVHSIAPE